MTKAQKKAKKFAAANKRRANEQARQAVAQVRNTERAEIRKIEQDAKQEILIKECEVIAKIVRDYSDDPTKTNYLGDCIDSALVARAAFRELYNRDTEFVAGFAAYQFGVNDYDSMSHDGRGEDTNKFGGHAWLEIDGFIFDPTTWGLQSKAAKLDERDEYTTTHTYKFDDWMLFPKSDSRTRANFRKGDIVPGNYYYEANAEQTLLAMMVFFNKSTVEDLEAMPYNDLDEVGLTAQDFIDIRDNEIIPKAKRLSKPILQHIDGGVFDSVVHF